MAPNPIFWPGYKTATKQNAARPRRQTRIYPTSAAHCNARRRRVPLHIGTFDCRARQSNAPRPLSKIETSISGCLYGGTASRCHDQAIEQIFVCPRDCIPVVALPDGRQAILAKPRQLVCVTADFLDAASQNLRRDERIAALVDRRLANFASARPLRDFCRIAHRNAQERQSGGASLEQHQR